MGEKGAAVVAKAFNQHFGLNLKGRTDLGRDSALFARVATEVKAGIPPSFDVLKGQIPLVLQMKEQGLTGRLTPSQAKPPDGSQFP